jgi:hypothetical protein
LQARFSREEQHWRGAPAKSELERGSASRKMRVYGLLVHQRILYFCSILYVVLDGEHGHQQKGKVKKKPVNIGEIIRFTRKRKTAKGALYNFELFSGLKRLAF